MKRFGIAVSILWIIFTLTGCEETRSEALQSSAVNAEAGAVKIVAHPSLGDKVIDILSKSSESLGTAMLAYAAALAAIGTIVMAVLELLKAVLRLRYLFHHLQVGKWIGTNPELQKEFMALTTGDYGSKSALFDQPIEKLMAQVQAGANIAMDFPDRYPKFYTFLTRQFDLGRTKDAELWINYASGLRKDTSPGELPSASDEDREAGKARARLQNVAARKLDAFQTETEYRWARTNQFVSIAMGSALIYYLLMDSSTGQTLPLTSIVIVALLGGMAAPVAKDMVATLSSFRRG
ncbi:MAG: hypothetical protein E6Q59_10105 [Nitrosomonas sp.]|nr:MAG: hypothetical protein E6Q59_10105 [Nitrosomonas sp.]